MPQISNVESPQFYISEIFLFVTNTSVEQVLTFGCSSVILRMLAPFLPMMKRWSQAGAVTSDVATLFACKQFTVPYISQLQTIHSTLHQSTANKQVSCTYYKDLT